MGVNRFDEHVVVVDGPVKRCGEHVVVVDGPVKRFGKSREVRTSESPLVAAVGPVKRYDD